MALDWQQYSGKWNLQTQGQAVGDYAWPGTVIPNTLWTSGNNNNGQLGLGDTVDRSSPTQVGYREGWLQAAGGYRQSYAVKSDGTAWSWGDGNFGQLGQGSTTDYSSPVQIGALTNWLNLAGLYYGSVATKTDGTLWSWGYNAFGQLGLNSAVYATSSPVQVGALTTWSKVRGLQNVVGALKTDGTIWAWGQNNYGQIGDGTTTQRSSPVQIGALTTWTDIAVGYFHMLAVKTGGTLWAWGANSQGELAQGNVTTKSSPVQVGALTTWSKVFALNGISFAVKTDGTLWGWGYRGEGQIGDGTSGYPAYSSPVQVGALTTWTGMSLFGTRQVVVRKADGTAWSWGYGGQGRLGQGSTTSYSSPVQVGTGTYWTAVGSGMGQSFFMGAV
jgi:alpha-tubulin suppressor-like RCC1 family protein